MPLTPEQQAAMQEAEQAAGKPPGLMSRIATGVMDVVKSVPRGIRLGEEGLAGIGGDIYNAEFAAARKVAEWMRRPDWVRYINQQQAENPQVDLPFGMHLPTSQEVRENVTNPVLGAPGKAATPEGQVAETVGTFIPGMGKSLTRSVVAPAIGTEVGGYVGRQLGNETLGRLLGGVGGALAPGAASRLVAGPQLTADRARLVNTMMNEGVDLTAGQASGRKGLQYLEVGPFETKPAAVKEMQGQQLNRAALKRAGIAADRATPEVMQDAYDNFGTQYDDVVARSGGAPLDSQLQTDLLQTVDDFHRLKSLPPNAPTAVNGYLKRISDAAQNNGGVIPADTFKTIRSDISRDLRSSKDPEVIQALRRLNDGMFDSIGRNGPPDIVEQWKDINNRYRNYKVIEKAMGGTSEATMEGFITPQRLATATAGGDKGAFVRGQGDYADLARASALTMKDLPQSGTAARGAAMLPFYLAGQRLLEGHPLQAAASVMPSIGLAAASKLVTAKPVRTTLIRNITGQGPPLLDPMTAALLMRQQERGQ